MHELIKCRGRIKIIYGKINEIAGVYIRILCVSLSLSIFPTLKDACKFCKQMSVNAAKAARFPSSIIQTFFQINPRGN